MNLNKGNKNIIIDIPGSYGHSKIYTELTRIEEVLLARLIFNSAGLFERSVQINYLKVKEFTMLPHQLSFSEFRDICNDLVGKRYAVSYERVMSDFNSTWFNEVYIKGTHAIFEWGYMVPNVINEENYKSVVRALINNH